MKWFKHQSDMIEDPKIRRLVKKHGAEAYAVYNLVIERVVKRLEKDSPIPDLEETGEDIADMLRMDTLKVQEVMWACIETGLFEQDEITGRIVAAKVYKFILKSETRSEEIRQMVDKYKLSGTVTDSLRLSQTNVIDKDRDEDTDTDQIQTPPTSKPSKKQQHTLTDGDTVPIGRTTYDRLCQTFGETIVHEYIERAYRYAVGKKGKKSYYKDYALAAENYMKRDDVKPQGASQFAPPELDEEEAEFRREMRERMYGA